MASFSLPGLEGPAPQKKEKSLYARSLKTGCQQMKCIEKMQIFPNMNDRGRALGDGLRFHNREHREYTQNLDMRSDL